MEGERPREPLRYVECVVFCERTGCRGRQPSSREARHAFHRKNPLS